MFKSVPVQVWLLILIALLAYPPAQYVYRYIAAAPSRRDIMSPQEDLGWRTRAQFARCVAVLTGLVIFAVFIFTPAAAAFARSPAFMPILMAALGAWSLYTVPRGLANGSIEPLIRGVYSAFERTAQPIRFWLSVAWNASMGSFFLIGAYTMLYQGFEDLCYYRKEKRTPQEELDACENLIRMRGVNGADYADLMTARGVAYYHLGNLGQALHDYDEALKRDPRQSYALYNRALIMADRADNQQALADLSASLKIRANNSDGFLNRGVIYMRLGQMSEASSDFTKALELSPRDTRALAHRGLSFALAGDRSRAIADFKLVKVAAPQDPVMAEGLAVLNLRQSDL